MIDPTVYRARRIARLDVLLRGEEAGVGPTVLLLHAGGERRQVWTPVIDVLVDAGFRCVAFDQRGHGDSGGSQQALAPCADDVAAMLHAEPPGCVVVGASLGGLAAIAALGDPAVRTRVAGLVLVDVVPNLVSDEFGNIIFVSDPAPGCDHDMKKREGEVKEILDLAGSVIADKGFQGSGYVTPAKKPQDRELYRREHEYNNQVSSIRAPIERAVAHLKTWKVLFTDYRRPLNTFLDSFRAAIGLYFFELSFQ